MDTNLKAYYTSKDNQISNMINLQKGSPANPSAVWDLLTGCFHDIPTNDDGYKVYLKTNAETPLLTGKLKVYKRFIDSDEDIPDQEITFAQLNAAGETGISVYDFKNAVDAKVIFKIVILEDFTITEP